MAKFFQKLFPFFSLLVCFFLVLRRVEEASDSLKLKEQKKEEEEGLSLGSEREQPFLKFMGKNPLDRSSRMG